VKLIFARGYNPAYDYCLTKSFQDHGIAYGEESTFDEAKRLVLAFQEKAGMDPRWKDVFNPSAHKRKIPESETLFCLYVWLWSLGPGPRPAFQYLFAKSLGITSYPDARLYRELEHSLKEAGNFSSPRKRLQKTLPNSTSGTSVTLCGRTLRAEARTKG